MKTFLKLALAATVVVGSWAQAEYYENDGRYIYRVTKYTEFWSEQDAVKVTAQLAHKALISTLESMMTSHVIPEKVMNRSDLEKLRQTRKDMDDLVEYLNNFVNEQRARARYEFHALPDAVMLFGGSKFSLSFGKGVSGSAALGLVMMPVKVEKIDPRTAQVVETSKSIRMGLVGWPSGDVGLGIGAGLTQRVGLAFIYDLNSAFTRPEQFWGAGFGVSWTPVIAGFGINVKMGMLSNWELPGWIDFAYASAALEIGAAAEISSPRLNLTTVISGAELMTMFEDSQKKAMQESIKETNRMLNEVVRDGRLKLREGQSTGNDDDEDQDSGSGQKGGDAKNPGKKDNR